MTTKPPDKATQAWEFFLNSLPASARKALVTSGADMVVASPPEDIPDESSDSYERYLCSLPQSVRDYMTAKPPPSEAVESSVDPRTAQFLMLECADGGWPVMRTCRTPEAVAKRMSELEGTDTVVVALYGLALQFTKGPQRYLFLPGRKKAIQVPMYKGGPLKTVGADLLSGFELQSDGYLGPDELVQGLDFTEELVKVTPAVDDDEEEDEDDGA